MLSEDQIDYSILAHIGSLVAWIFAPLGWGNWKAAVASITGLVAKENIVGTLGILYGGGDETVYQALGAVFTQISGYSFLVFNLLCASLLCSHRRHQAGNEQRQVDLVRHRLSVRLRGGCHRRSGLYHLYAGSSLQGSHQALR